MPSTRHVLVGAGIAFCLGLGVNQIVLLFVYRIRPYVDGVSNLRHEVLIFCLKLFQPLELITVHAAIFLAPSIVGLNCYTDLPNSLGN